MHSIRPFEQPWLDKQEHFFSKIFFLLNVTYVAWFKRGNASKQINGAKGGKCVGMKMCCGHLLQSGSGKQQLLFPLLDCLNHKLLNIGPAESFPPSFIYAFGYLFLEGYFQFFENGALMFFSIWRFAWTTNGVGGGGGGGGADAEQWWKTSAHNEASGIAYKKATWAIPSLPGKLVFVLDARCPAETMVGAIPNECFRKALFSKQNTIFFPRFLSFAVAHQRTTFNI